MSLVLGMCLTMKIVGDGSSMMFVLGIIIGVIGIFDVCMNYPIYKKNIEKGKQKYAYDIMQLAKEISESAK